MARNQEKAQSMLFRFREAQANSLGLSSGSKNLRRPRLASSVSSIKECEKWRSEVIREISRKVSKIQDFGLTDYEVRDLNDEINKLMREKGHWETQILALGGANYKRGALPAGLDDTGREVRGGGSRGYKYFGRAKDLPGVRELLGGGRDGTGQKSQQEKDTEDSFKHAKYRRFRHLDAEYYGDRDEDDGLLLSHEVEAEREEWRHAYLETLRTLHPDMDTAIDAESHGSASIPDIPRPHPKPLHETMQALHASFSEQYTAPAAAVDGQDGDETTRKPADADADAGTETETANATASVKRKPDASTAARSNKKLKTQSGDSAAACATEMRTDGGELDSAVTDSHPHPQPQLQSQAQQERHEPPARIATNGTAAQAISYSLFSPSDLAAPATPDRRAIETLILHAKKRQLWEEYIGASTSPAHLAGSRSK
ncbi:Isy1-domain-containing protein [Testicularia cyperi]|uniref:Isy1-domain-containing protein n=1 Tax=Testicularia cyperi TaxID=1882483 RepID=A0A317XYF1_9BASI|nr:Isy1-domain-containing protein [Testicularia cyperi]